MNNLNAKVDTYDTLFSCSIQFGWSINKVLVVGNKLSCLRQKREEGLSISIVQGNLFKIWSCDWFEINSHQTWQLIKFMMLYRRFESVTNILREIKRNNKGHPELQFQLCVVKRFFIRLRLFPFVINKIKHNLKNVQCCIFCIKLIYFTLLRLSQILFKIYFFSCLC